MSQDIRKGDLVLAQGTYAFVQDGASGHVEVLVGPHKVSLAETDKPVIYDDSYKRFIQQDQQAAVKICPIATEGQYIQLTNPCKDDPNKHPGKGKQQTMELSWGSKINIQGPCTFALFPGQTAKVVDGHQLKFNEYLLVRVYNEELAKANLASAVVKGASENAIDTKSKKDRNTPITEKDLVTGNILLIKGTDVSFYIPPTGIEIVPDKDGLYVRQAVTLERLEYCILLDESGEKSYVQGPAVVFPKPTEQFVETNNNKKFQAIELNENMGIYVKVIADYQEGSKPLKAGDELFITGKEQKIYFPRPEHALIKCGQRIIHYAVAIPKGEARYVLNKTTGEVETVFGPAMFLPDPRTQVIVRRGLDEKTCTLWYPGNTEALLHNKALMQNEKLAGAEYVTDEKTIFKTSASTKSRTSFTAVAGDMVHRNSGFTEPRSIQLNTKYDGAISINIWPGYAVQIVGKDGSRKVEEGPKNIILNYDETLEVLELSTGTPKTDARTIKTVYLQTKSNIVSDTISAETKDMIPVDLKVSYRVNFKGEKERWFNVPNYIKLMTEHLRSVVRAEVKKYTIEKLIECSTDIVRDTILGSKPEIVDNAKTTMTERTGKYFAENGMHVYDVEVLDLDIKDENIQDLIAETQTDIVEKAMELTKEAKLVMYVSQTEEFKRKKLKETAETENIKHALTMQTLSNIFQKEATERVEKLKAEEALDLIEEKRRARRQADLDVELTHKTKLTELSIKDTKEKAEAIQPKLIEAMITLGGNETMRILAENLKAQGGGLHGIFQKGGIEGLLETVKGTPLEAQLMTIFNKTITETQTKSGKQK